MTDAAAAAEAAAGQEGSEQQEQQGGAAAASAAPGGAAAPQQQQQQGVRGGRSTTWRSKLRVCQALEPKRITFGKSGIHGWGIFARQAIPADSMVSEFRGQLIRGILADVREASYRKQVGVGVCCGVLQGQAGVSVGQVALLGLRLLEQHFVQSAPQLGPPACAATLVQGAITLSSS